MVQGLRGRRACSDLGFYSIALATGPGGLTRLWSNALVFPHSQGVATQREYWRKEETTWRPACCVLDNRICPFSFRVLPS